MRYYITTPIYYVNDAPHIGHAYTSIVSDVFARRMRQIGREVYFLTGTDEHGQKIQKAAEAKGILPEKFVDEVSSKFKAMSLDFNLTNDDFIRTTEARHKEGVQQFWQKLEANGWIHKGTYKGWYSVRDEAYYSEDEIVDGKAPTGAPVEWQEEETYFFELSAFGEILSKIYESEEIVFPKSRLNEVKSFVRLGLLDLSISRNTFNWGIQVPSDKSHVIYVWLDALSNYITALGYPNGEAYKKFWLSKEMKIHFIGKDILRFHAIYWPAFLIAERYKKGEDNTEECLSFFKDFKVVSHGWWKNDGQKMSKSLGNAINPYDLVSKFGLDKVRYYFLKAMPFGLDGDYTESHFIEITNSDLANNVGNLTQRVCSFIQSKCDGIIPEGNQIYFTDRNFEAEFSKAIENFEFNKAVEVVMECGNLCNEFVDRSAPWRLFKEGETEQMNDVLLTLCMMIYRIFTMLECITPDSSKRVFAIFSGKFPEGGMKINTPEPIFLRI